MTIFDALGQVEVNLNSAHIQWLLSQEVHVLMTNVSDKGYGIAF